MLYVGGNYNQNTNLGLFYLNGNNAASNKNSNIGCRLICNENKYYKLGIEVAHVSEDLLREAV